MATNKELQQQAIGQPGEPESEKITKIRDILFGNNMTEYEKRFAQVEERLNKNLKDLSDDFNEKFNSLESYIKEEFSLIADQLKLEQSERIESDKKTIKDVNHIENSLARFKESTAKAQKEIKANVYDKIKLLNSDFKEQNKEIQNIFDKELNILREAKTDRSALAVLLTELALKLSGEENSLDK